MTLGGSRRHIFRIVKKSGKLQFGQELNSSHLNFSYLFNVDSIAQKGAREVKVAVVINGHGDLSSNPGRGCLHFTLGLVNRNQALLQQENARSCVTQMTWNKLQEFERIKLISHPAYHPDLASSDYYLFQSMAHFLYL